MGNSRELKYIVIEELGPDVECLRPLNGKKYFSGIEIGLVMASQFLISLFINYFKPFAEEIKGQAKIKGKEHAKLLIEKLDKLFRKLIALDLENTSDAKNLMIEADKEIDKSIEFAKQEDISISFDETYIEILEKELVEYGMAKHLANSYARSIRERLNERLRK